MLVVGIDEAGRGPVIGPMMMVGVLIDEKDSDRLHEYGVRDSKILCKNRRVYLSDGINDYIKHHKLIEISSKEIDEHPNLNRLELEKMAEIIDELKPDLAIIDCPSTNAKAFHNELRDLIKVKTEIKAEHKADANYPVVSAASVIAKVARDRWMEALEKKLDTKIGSGYPADPYTKEFLKKILIPGKPIPEYVRKKWSTVTRIMGESKQKKLGEY